MADPTYIHGTDPDEQRRLAKLGELTDDPFLRFLEFGPDSAILDVGSGLGNLARRVAAAAPAGEVWGVEHSAAQLARAAADRPNLHFVQADAHALPFPDGRFDVVYCRYLLEHVADPAGVLREMGRVLRPGGRLFAQENDILVARFDPDCPHFDALWRRFVQLQVLLGGDALIGKRLLRLFHAAGFTDVRLSIQPEVHWAGTPTFRDWVVNLIDNVRPAERLLVEKGLATPEEVQRGLDDLRRLLPDESASAFFYWNRARGQKPA
jgi:SAM-dependent methyltransferase